MTPGEVILFKNFRFKDGATKDKLVVILNYPRNDEPYLVCCTTSVQYNRLKSLGCHSDSNYYFVDKSQDGFDSDTWILFGEVYELSVDKILTAFIKSGTHIIFCLESSLWNAIKSCTLKSKDIAQIYLEMIERGEEKSS